MCLVRSKRAMNKWGYVIGWLLLPRCISDRVQTSLGADYRSSFPRAQQVATKRNFMITWHPRQLAWPSLAGIPVLWCGDRCWSGWKLSMPRPTGLHQQQENNEINNYTACNLAEVFFFYIISSLLRYTLHLKCHSGEPFLFNDGPRGAVKLVTHCLNIVLPISINQWEPDSYEQARFMYGDKNTLDRVGHPRWLLVVTSFVQCSSQLVLTSHTLFTTEDLSAWKFGRWSRYLFGLCTWSLA